MRLWMLLGLFIITGCLQTENSSSLDAGFAPDDNATPEFLAARAVLAQSCNGCHNYHTKTEAQLVADGVVVAGDAEASRLYGRLQNSTGSITPKDMPEGGSISAGDLDLIKTWINAIP